MWFVGWEVERSFEKIFQLMSIATDNNTTEEKHELYLTAHEAQSKKGPGSLTS
jgi:hypothetical protein